MLKIKYSLIALALVSSATLAANMTLSTDELNALLLAKTRPTEDAMRDGDRKPAQIMQFSEVAKGDVVVDLFAGGGWYSELYSMAVGDTGKVYAQNDSVIWKFAEKGMVERTKNNRLANLTRLDAIDIADMPVADNSVDLVFTALNYHDLFFTHMLQDGEKVVLREQPVDHTAALAKIKSILKDDGVFIIIDHHGAKGSGFDAPNNLHRIDADIVKQQLDEAGFALVEEAYYLTNVHDDPNSFVFAEGVRGKTSRFVYKFKKQ
ncbi:methyltransferase domain-containing protein [Alteromonadaceae bacterium BrNp21-10]|nr:methyltransferase domain-containing protein [Alteromonadaceae bacterium BrNp21-10]